jgi:hypothetical protein
MKVSQIYFMSQLCADLLQFDYYCQNGTPKLRSPRQGAPVSVGAPPFTPLSEFEEVTLTASVLLFFC